MSCDSYQDVWAPMVQSIEKFWPDCPFPIYMCSEQEVFNHSKIGNIRVGERMRWSEMLIEVLGGLSSKSVIYLQEDYILKGSIQTDEVERLIDFYESNDAAYLRLIPFPKPDEIVDEKLNVGLVLEGSSYRTSLQAAIWDRKVLLSLLSPDEDGWQFEKNSVARASHIQRPFYSVGINSDLPNKNHHRYPLDYYSTAILQGKWQKEGVKMLREAGINISTEKRGYLNRWDFYYYHQQKKQGSAYLQLLKFLDKSIFNRSKNFRKY